MVNILYLLLAVYLSVVWSKIFILYDWQELLGLRLATAIVLATGLTLFVWRDHKQNVAER